MDDRTVLLVEDNPDDVLLIRNAFRKAGARASLQVVGDGDEAVAYLGGEGAFADRLAYPMPALLLLDLKLPRRSGFEVLQWVRHNPATKHVPTIVLTSSNQHEDVRRAYECQANSYLVKPVARDALVAMLGTLDNYWLGLNTSITI